MHPFSHLDYLSFVHPQFSCLTALYAATRGYEQALFVHYPRQTVSLAVVFPLPAAIFFCSRRERRSPETNSATKKKNRDEGSRAWASRPNFHCILETAGYYEHEMFLLFPSPFSPISVFLPRLRLVSCLSPLVSLYVFWQILMVRWSWECKIRERIASLSSNNLYMSRGNQIALEYLDLTC